VKNFDPMAEMARMLSRVAPATVAPPVVRPTRPDQASEPTVTQSSRLATISAHSTIFQNFYYHARVLRWLEDLVLIPDPMQAQRLLPHLDNRPARHER
jgi:hypothetical protein